MVKFLILTSISSRRGLCGTLLLGFTRDSRQHSIHKIHQHHQLYWAVSPGYQGRLHCSLDLRQSPLLLCAPLNAGSLLNHLINQSEQYSQVQYIITPLTWKVIPEARSEKWINETGREEKQMQAWITEFAIAIGDWCWIPWDHLKSLIKCVSKPPATSRMKEH